MASEQHGALVGDERLGQSFNRFNVKVVSWFVQNQHVVITQQQTGHAHSGSFSTGQDSNRFSNMRATKQQRTGNVQAILSRHAGHGVVFQVLQDSLVLGKRGIHVLRVDSDLTTISPLGFAIDWLE